MEHTDPKRKGRDQFSHEPWHRIAFEIEIVKNTMLILAMGWHGEHMVMLITSSSGLVIMIIAHRLGGWRKRRIEERTPRKSTKNMGPKGIYIKQKPSHDKDGKKPELSGVDQPATGDRPDHV